jgi:hypothetical protein
MNFNNLVISILNEEMTAGGEGSVFGSGVVSTSTETSGDNYASGDARNPYGIFGGILSRGGMRGKKRSKKRSKKRKKKKSKSK